MGLSKTKPSAKKSYTGMRTGILILYIFCLFSSLTSKAQNNDAALWTNVYLEKKLTKKYNVHLNMLARFNENYSQLGLAYADFGFTCKLKKYLNVNVDYVNLQLRGLDGTYKTRHQYYISLVFKKDLGRFRLSYRTMLQNQYTELLDSRTGKIPFYIFRNKFTIKYTLNKYFTPYIAQEFYYHFNQGTYNGFFRSRSFIGVFYTLTKRSTLEFFYAIQKGFNVYDPQNVFALGIGFSHLFK
jgi:hypothetical protein